MSVTLLITTFNRGDLLRRSLERLCALTLPDELIVVDDGGSDGTDGVCREFEGRLPIRYIHNHSPQPTICSMARNIGIRESTCDRIVTSEPELVFQTDVLAQFAELAPEHPDEVISAGHIYFLPALHMPESGPAGEEAIGWVAPYTAMYRKSWLEEIGGWDEGFPGPWGWDDTDLLTRLRINGHGQHIALDVVALHQWHGLGADAGAANEHYWLSKSFHGDETNTTDVVANKEGEWGRIRTPSS